MATVTFTIDNKEITAEKGTTILNAALENGIHIPHYCYHPELRISGNCRICLVEVEKMPKLTISCNTVAGDGMVVKTDSPKVIKARKGVMELLLINHPLDCPVCDKAGECKLQDYSYEYGNGSSRFEEKKITQKKKDIGKHIMIYSDRCILCTRCVRFTRDVSGTAELGITNRGGHCEINVFPENRLDNKLSGNVVDICPVGSLTSKEFLFKSRVWYLKKHESICNRCSAGCNITVETKDDKVYRVTPRPNPEVNSHWMCDIGRYGWGDLNKEKRLKTPLVKKPDKHYPADWDASIKAINDNFSKITKNSAGAIGAILSAGATNEENYLLGRLMKTVLKSDTVAIHKKNIQGSDEKFPLGFVIEADKDPNYLGASQMLSNSSPEAFDSLNEKILSGKIKGLYIVNDRAQHGFSADDIELFKKLDFLVVQDSYQSDLTAIADIVLPGTIFLEKDGTFTNSGGVVQRIRRTLFPSNDVKDGWQIIQNIASSFGTDFGYNSSKEIFNDIAKDVSSYNGLSYKKLGSKGAKV